MVEKIPYHIHRLAQVSRFPNAPCHQSEGSLANPLLLRLAATGGSVARSKVGAAMPILRIIAFVHRPLKSLSARIRCIGTDHRMEDIPVSITLLYVQFVDMS